MITEVKIFQCNEPGSPSDEDIFQAIATAKELKCIVELNWTVFQGRYYRKIYPDDTLEKVRDSLPKVYGV